MNSEARVPLCQFSSEDTRHIFCCRDSRAFNNSNIDCIMNQPLSQKQKIAIGLCTYARQDDLNALLRSLARLELDEAVELRIIVVDNDPNLTAKETVKNAQAYLQWPIHYAHEPEAGIPFARNRVIQEAGTEGFLAFVDDDETVDPQWLNELVKAQAQTNATFVQGPVEMTVEQDRDAWWLESAFFKQKSFADLSPRHESWTNNVLIDLAFVGKHGCAFDAALRYDGGSDTLFFQDIIAAGGTGRYAAKAIVFEIQKPGRLSWKWGILRQYRYGITRSNTVLLRRSRSAAFFYCIVRGVAMLGLGVAKLPGAMVWGRVGLVDSIALMARGCGVISGFFGGRRREYAR